MSPVNGIRFGALVLDDSVQKSGKSKHGESWAGVWDHVRTTDLKELERLTDADIVVSVPDKQRHTVTMTNNETGEAIPIVGVNDKPLELDIFELRAKNRHSGEFVGEPLLVQAEEKYVDLQKLVLNFALKAYRPVNNHWPVGQKIKEIMEQARPSKSLQDQFADTWYQLWRGKTLASLPPVVPNHSLREQVSKKAEPNDWLQYFWQAMPERARTKSWEDLDVFRR